jgi:5-formyltetrahydrofolate cyclo-ligase
MLEKRVAYANLREPEVLQKLADFLLNLPKEYTISVYSPIKAEINVLKLISHSQLSKRIFCLPVIEAYTPDSIRVLKFREYKEGMTLQKGSYGIPIPPPLPHHGENSGYIMPDVIITPLLAFDDNGFRLGYGGGYFDATIAHYRQNNLLKYALGIAYEWQKLDELPPEPTDEKLDFIITECITHDYRGILGDERA